VQQALSTVKKSRLATSAHGIKRQFFGPGNPDSQRQPGLKQQ
jgi:hypothetical protein